MWDFWKLLGLQKNPTKFGMIGAYSKSNIPDMNVFHYSLTEKYPQMDVITLEIRT